MDPRGRWRLADERGFGVTLATNTISVEDSLLRYQRIRSHRAADLVLRARKRCQETHAFDPEATQAWYDRLRTEDGSGIIRGIVGNIVDSPINLGGGGLGPEGVDLR